MRPVVPARRGRLLSALLVGALLTSGAGPARALQAPAPVPPAESSLARWEPDIRAFEEHDRQHPPAPGGVLFVGSSSIALWTTLAADFPGLNVLNRGFGGSQIHEVTACVPRIVLPYRPKQIVMYCGSNDVVDGHRTADQVVADFKAFVATVHRSLPDTRIAYISNAPNPARWSYRGVWTDLNARIAAFTQTDPRLAFIDIWPAMLGSDGGPRPELFVADQLHMNANGYAIWTRIVGNFLRRTQ
jgi:lysophospholipase L1-like esterase